MGRWLSQRPAAVVECAKELLRGEVTDVTKDFFEDGIIQGFDNYLAASQAVTAKLFAVPVSVVGKVADVAH